jgi:hypothetical protein
MQVNKEHITQLDEVELRVVDKLDLSDDER